MRSIDELQDELLGEFELLEDWLDRYQLLIDMGQALEPGGEGLHADANLIAGCQSRVWIRCEPVHSPEHGEEVLHFEADSDAVITKGIAALLLRVLEGQPASAVAGADLYMLERLGLEAHLSPTRANGLRSMLEKIRHYAVEAVVGKRGS